MEKNNYNINRNPKPLSKEEIQQYQDFDALLEQFNQAPKSEETGAEGAKVRSLGQRRPIWTYAAAAAVIGLCFLGALSYLNSGSANNDQLYFASQDYVNPPIATAKASFVNYKVDANQGGTYTYGRRGSRVVIPPRAFMDRSGNIVQGEVDIRYKEYHDFVDFFLAGIPMEYDSAGVQYILESAGMIEIYAEQNGERVYMTPEENIAVELISEIALKDSTTAPTYNIYKLDEDKRNWVYQTVDNIQILEKVESASTIFNSESEIETAHQSELTTVKTNYEKELKTIEASVPKAVRPRKPRRADGSNFSFDLDFLDNNTASNQVSSEHQAVNEAVQAVSDLQAQYEGTIWEVLPNQPQFNESTAQTIWEDIKLNRLNNRDYQVTLIKGAEQVNVKVIPVLSGKDYEQAMTGFEEAMAVYETKMAAREEKLADAKKALEEKRIEAKVLADANYEERLAILKAKGANAQATDEMMKYKILNRFNINSFGVWNCDRPLPPHIYNLRSDFQSKNNKDYKGNVAYIVNKNRNTVVRFVANKGKMVNFDQSGENLMWLLTEENKIAVFRPEEFKKIEKGAKNYTFVLDLVDEVMNTEEDIRKVLKF